MRLKPILVFSIRLIIQLNYFTKDTLLELIYHFFFTWATLIKTHCLHYSVNWTTWISELKFHLMEQIIYVLIGLHTHNTHALTAASPSHMWLAKEGQLGTSFENQSLGREQQHLHVLQSALHRAAAARRCGDGANRFLAPSSWWNFTSSLLPGQTVPSRCANLRQHFASKIFCRLDAA